MRSPAKHFWRQTFEDLTAQGQLAFNFVGKAISIRVTHMFFKGKASGRSRFTDAPASAVVYVPCAGGQTSRTTLDCPGAGQSAATRDRGEYRPALSLALTGMAALPGRHRLK